MFALFAMTALPMGAGAVTKADVLIQAGHEGRPDCGLEPGNLCNNTGQPTPPGERAWTPIVADEATKILRASGITVLRKSAFLSGQYKVTDAVFLHFDGAAVPCSSAASVGYRDARSRSAAQAWKALYGRYFPYGFEGDNFTTTLHHYYGLNHVEAGDAAMVIEFGEMSCPRQYAWLRKHLDFEARLLAYFLSRRLHRGNVPLPNASSLSENRAS